MLTFFLDILEITAGTSLLVLVMLLVLRLVGKKFTAKCRYILWTLVLVRLAIPFSFNMLPALIEVPVEPTIIEHEVLGEVEDKPPLEYEPVETNTVQTNPGVQEQVPSNPVIPTIPTTPTVPNTPTTPTNPTIPTIPNQGTTNPGVQDETPPEPVVVPTTPEEPVAEKEPLSWRQILDIASVVYVVGGVVFLLWNLVSYALYTRKILRSARIADARTLAVLLSICEKENLKKVPILLVSPAINSPAAFGIFRRKIILPDISFTQNGLAGTLFHEVVHCKRGDLYIKVIELVARSFHWFNPLAHVSAFRCEMEMEMSCDETVLSGCNDDARAAYGEVMLDIIRRCRRNRGALTTHFNPKKSSVKARFANIIYGSGKRRGRILIAACLVLCAIAGTLIACTIEETPEVVIKDYKINVLVDEEVDGADGYNRDIHIIEVDIDSEHEAEINKTISAYFLDLYNEYMSSPGSAYDFPYQLIDTSYSVKNNILAITGVSRYSATSVPWSMVQSVFYDIENDKLCTVQEYFETAGLDWDKARSQALKMLKTHSQYEHLVWEISGVVYNEADEPVLVVKADNTNIDSEQIKYVYLIGYDFDEYCETNRDEHFDGFDEIVWQDIPIELTISNPSNDLLASYDEAKIIDVTSDDYPVYIAVTSNVDVNEMMITELIWDDLKLTDSKPLYKIDLKAGEPQIIAVSFPGAVGNRALTYYDTYGVYRRFEITKSGEDGTPMLVEIAYSSLSEDFVGSDLGDVLVPPPVDPKTYVNVTSNPGGLDFHTIVIPFNYFSDLHEFDEEHYLAVTYNIEKDANSNPLRYTDYTIYLINTVTGTLEDYVTLGTLLYRPTQKHYVSDGLVLFDLQYNEADAQYNIPGAYKITVQNGRLNVAETTTEAFPHHDGKLVSPDGNWTVYDTTDDGTGRGGIDVMHRGLNMITRILTNVMADDPGVTSLGDITGYSPIQFIDNNRLLYHIGGWEWTQGYGIYNLATGEKTEFRNGYAAIGYADGYIYLSKSGGYETVSWHRTTLDGSNIEFLASVNEEDGVLHLSNWYEFDIGSTSWRDVYYASSYSSMGGTETLNTTIYSPDCKTVLAEVTYDCSNAEIYAISHNNTETAIVFVEGAEMPEKEQSAEPVVKVLENGNNYRVHTVYISVEDYRYKVFEYGDNRWIYMTYDNVVDTTGYVHKFTNIHLYLFDTFKGSVVAECDIDGEYRLDTSSTNLDGGIILYDIVTEGDGQYVEGAFAVKYDPASYKLTAEKIDAPLFPRYKGRFPGKLADGTRVTITQTTDGGWGSGGIDIIMPDGTMKRILSNVVLDQNSSGISLSDVAYYYPVNTVGNTKLVYGIGSYEGPDKGFGIYDLTTGEREEYVHQNYVVRSAEYGCLIYEEIRYTNEGFRTPYRIWMRNHDGEDILLASTDEADGVFHITDDLWYVAEDGHTDNLIRFDVGNYREEEDFLAPNLNYTTAVLLSPGDVSRKVITIEYPRMTDYYDNLYCDSNLNFTVVVPIDPAAMPAEKPTVFTSVDEAIATYGDEIYWLADRLYSAEQFKEAVESFLNPEHYRESYSELYESLSAMKITDSYITYDKAEKKFYVTFNITGTPVGTLKVGENTCEIVANAYDLGVMCYDDQENYSSEARIAVNQYINAACSVDPDKMYGMPDETFDDAIFFTDYIVWRLEDLGVTPTRDAVIDYAKRCFGLENYSPRADQFDENGNHVQFGYGGIHPAYAVTSETEENGVVSVTVQFFNHSLGHILGPKVVYRVTKLSDGAWKFIEVTEVGSVDTRTTYTAPNSDAFFDLIWNLKENGTIPTEPYDVEITGFSVPVVMHMIGDAKLGSIEVFGQIVPMTDRNSPEDLKFVYLYGNCGDKELFEYDGKLIFVDTFYDVGNTYIIDSEGVDVLRNNGSTSTSLFLNDKGELRYKTVHSGMGDMVVAGRLVWATGYDDFYMEEGQAFFRDGELMFMRESYLTMSDGYDLDKEFEVVYKDKTTGIIYNSIEDIFEDNKKKFAEVVSPIYIPAEGGVYGMIDYLHELVDKKELPKSPYDIYVTGLSVPLVIHMAGGQSILSVEAYGFVQDMTSPDYRAVLFDGSTLPRVFEVGENVVFNLSSGSYYGGTTYIFSKYGCSLVKSGSQSSVYLFLDESGNLKYRFSTRRTSGIQQGLLWEIVSFDEFYYSIGEAEIVNGEVILSVPYEVYTVSDAFDDLDTMFDKDIYTGFETVEELFAANLKLELDYRATTFSPEKYVSDVNIHTGKEVLLWDKIFVNPVYLYFVPIENGAKEFTVYYTDDYGLSLEKLNFTLPADIPFDTAEVVWTGGGGGSGEFQFVVKLTKGNDTTYISYNNFSYKNSVLEFEYAGVVSDYDLANLSASYPATFMVETYHEAERIYALFTGYGIVNYSSESIEYNGQTYQRCNIPEISSLAELRNLVNRYFSDELTDTLMNKTVEGVGAPLYIEQNGKLYRFSGYVGQWGYNAPVNYTWEVLLYSNGEYNTKVTAQINNYGKTYTTSVTCKYMVEPEGYIRFTEFPLMVKALWDTAASTSEVSEAAVAQNACMDALYNNRALYYAATGEEMYIKDYLGKSNDTVVKYAIVDLNGDNKREIVVCDSNGNYLVLHYDAEVVYGYTIDNRSFREPKADGTYSIYPGATNWGVFKMDFISGERVQTQLAYYRADFSMSLEYYYLGSNTTTRDQYDAFMDAHNQKPDLEWIEYTTNN